MPDRHRPLQELLAVLPLLLVAAFFAGTAAFAIGITTGSDLLALLPIAIVPPLAALGGLQGRAPRWQIAACATLAVAASLGVLFWALGSYST